MYLHSLGGIGQALTYQQGAHVSYLAAAADTVGQHTDLLRALRPGISDGCRSL
jgi:hypothetical protein